MIAEHFNADVDSSLVRPRRPRTWSRNAFNATPKTIPLPRTTKLAVNEIESATNNLFWLELINYDTTNKEVGGLCNHTG